MDVELTYNEIDDHVNSLIWYLQNKTNLKKGDKVALQMPNLLQYPIAIFACLKAGFVIVNTNPLYTADEMLHQYNDSGAKAVIIVENFAFNLEKIISKLEGQLTGTILAENELEQYDEIVDALQNRVGRIIFNGVPTGVEVCLAMVHGGPYPASTDSRFTAVGTNSIKRWVRPFSYQSWPNELLPNELKNENPLEIFRSIDGKQTNNKI